MVIDFYGNGGSGGGVTPQQVQAQIDSALTQYTETEDFATINGSGITNGGNITVADPDMSAYWTSAQTEDAINTKVESAYTILDDHIVDVEEVTASAYTELHNMILEISGSTPSIDLSDYWTSAQTKDYVDEAVSGTDLSAYWTSAETQSAISTASGSLQTQIDTMDEVVADALNDINGKLANKVSSSFVTNIWKGTQAQYDAISAKTATTLYIII